MPGQGGPENVRRHHRHARRGAHTDRRIPLSDGVGVFGHPAPRPPAPFGLQHKRVTAALAEARNRFVSALADRLFLAHAAPGSRTMTLCDELHARGKQIVTVSDPANSAMERFADPL